MEFWKNFDFREFLQKDFFAQPAGKIIFAAVFFLLILIAIKIFRRVILQKFKNLAAKTKTDIDDEIVRIVENISGFFWAIFAIFLTMKTLALGAKIEKITNAIFIFFAIFEIINIAKKILEFLFEKFFGKKDETAISAIKLILKIGIWTIGALLILSNLGVNISALATSMGIGGIAIALAAQNILSDLFASFTIYFDKPFKVGDYIVIGTDRGIVKRIGLKTTRIETIIGDELVVSNKELTESRVQNFKKMKRRRWDFSLGVAYHTPPEKLKRIPEIVKKIIDDAENAQFFRAHFFEFGESNLIFKISFFVESREYEIFLDTLHEINLQIAEIFDREKIEFAFPTRTIFVHK